MKQRSRIYYSAEQKNLMWDRWQAGDSTYQIARLFDRGHSSIQGILAKSGGIRPPPRQRSRFALTLSERNVLHRSVEVAINSSPSTLIHAGLLRD